MPEFIMRGLTFVVVLCATLIGLSSCQEAGQSARVILVSGATGTQGGAVARELASRGYAVRGLTRDPDSDASAALGALGIEMVRGDFDDAASLDAALQGAYGAFSVQQYRGVGVDAEIRQSKAFADAAKRAGVEHFVYSSVLYARLGTGVPQFESKREIEDYIRALDIPYSIVRPAGFMRNLEGVRAAAADGRYRTVFPPERETLLIAPRDIGRIVAEAFDQPANWIGRELAIAGERISYADVAATMSRVMGRPVVYEQIPWEGYAASATPAAVARETWFMRNEVPLDLEGLQGEFPGLWTVEDYLIEAGWANP
jgi:uncharacterized protein YbjT (DUF2867 family)